MLKILFSLVYVISLFGVNAHGESDISSILLSKISQDEFDDRFLIKDGLYVSSDQCAYEITNYPYPPGKQFIFRGKQLGKNKCNDTAFPQLAERESIDSYYDYRQVVDINESWMTNCSTKDRICTPKEIFYDNENKLLIKLGDRITLGLVIKVFNSTTFEAWAETRHKRNGKLINLLSYRDIGKVFTKK